MHCALIIHAYLSQYTIPVKEVVRSYPQNSMDTARYSKTTPLTQYSVPSATGLRNLIKRKKFPSIFNHFYTSLERNFQQPLLIPFC